jgi:diaminohydroxyphosphoribosylaminopyrimidine deaminase/5-amino-6-(5-phosphoribosylamino)uracil reductase
MSDEAKKYMRLALGLAKKARGRTFPNPLVGAVVVKNGEIVGRGYHKKAGGPHAEIFALKEAGIRTRGASLFSTLEPCAHHGLTGPCVDKIIEAEIDRVYVGMVDPNPLTQGKSIRRLRESGISVRTGILEDEIRELNAPFIQAMTKKQPYVTVKIAESLDGKAATWTGESKWITNEASRRYSHNLRRFFDGIMVGINTVLKDDPRLDSAKGHSSKHRLTKIIVDSSLRTPLNAKLLTTNAPVVIAAVKKNRAKEKELAKKGARVIYTRAEKGRVDLKDFLKKLHSLNVRSILVEGGSELIGSFLDKRLAQEALVFISPKIIGGHRALTAVRGQGVRSLDKAIHLKRASIKRFKEDLFIRGVLSYC